MAARFCLMLAIATLGGAHLHAQSQIIVDDNFDSYSDATDLQTDWVKIGTGVGGVDLINELNNPYAFPDLQGNAAQFDGASGVGASTAYKWNTAFTIAPDADHVVKLTFDQFVPSSGEGNSNWKTTVGLRGPAAENLIEFGIHNSNPSPFVPYGFRLVNLFPSAQNAGFGMTEGGYGALALPDTMNIPSDAEIGGGWHRFEATISTTSITFTIDLYRDGLANDPVDTVPGVGTAGVDATTVIAPEGGLTISAAGFNDLRFGVPSASGSSATVTAFDNIKLELVTVSAPAGNNADFNNDLVVDGPDFLIWQRGIGSTPAVGDKTTGDANGDQLVDAADLAVWQSKFGGAPAVSAIGAVPEPTSLALAGLAVAVAGLTARRR